MAKNSVITVSEIIDLLGGYAETGRICGYRANQRQRGFDMKARDSIPLRHWPAILRDAKLRRLREITPVSLIEAHVGHRLEV